MDLIFHITTRDAWERSKPSRNYRGDTLSSEGFIHCSSRAQVTRVANARFHGAKGLVLLCIDPQRLAAKPRWEPAERGELFPHVYGPIETAAVVHALRFDPGSDGEFSFPVIPGEQPPGAAPRSRPS